LESEKVHDKLKEYCNDKDGKAKEDKCGQLEKRIQGKCKTLENELDGVLKERPVKSSNCTQYESQCLFLGACSKDVIEKCSELRNDCYETKRNEIAEEIALRALKGGLKQGKEKECEKKLKEHCPILGRMSHELMEKCLDPKGACKSLITEAENKCDSLKDKVKKAVKNVNDKTCHPLLEECYFYGPNCDNDTENECKELRTMCEEKDIIYMPPEEPWFPIQPRVSIIEEVGLEGLYKAIAEEGILINKLKLPSMDDLIFFLSQKKENGEFDQEECKNAHEEEQCNYLKTLSRHSDYECSKMKDECDKLKNKFDKERKDLEGRIKENKLFSENNGPGQAKTISWYKLYSDIYGRNCAQLQSDCFFLSRYKNKLTTACDNVQAMCYKRGLDVVAYETLESQMRGEFHDSGENWPNNSQKKLVEVCNGVRNQSYHLLELCLHPEKTYLSLFRDIQMKVIELDHILDITRDFPEEDHCLKLEPECNRLKEEDTRLLGFCHTLERNCYHLRESQNVRNLLLEERKNYFENIEKCTSILDKKCQNWLRKLNKQFKLSCALQNDTCRIMTFDTSLHCENLKENIKEKKIVTELTNANSNMDQLRELCPSWVSYCDTLLPSCQSDLAEKENNETLCPGIQKLCKPYQTRQTLEDAVLYKFQGHLENESKCNSTLEERCFEWTQENNTFSSLCKSDDTYDSNKNNDTVRKELCQRLVKKVKKLCKTLPSKLEEENKELAKRIEVYNDLKNKTENATKGTNVILTFSIENNSTDKTNNSTGKTNNSTSHALVKRSERQPPITVLEASTFDLVAMVITEYVELKEKCKKLSLDCGFKEECEDSKNTCSKIEKTCGELKPLEMKQPQTITNTETSTSTVTQNVTVDSEGKPICTAGAPSININCTSIHTTDTWVTHTSTHTSTKTQTSTVTSKVTIVSTKKCQPTQCTTDRTHPTHTSGGEEAGDVKPSGGIRMNGWGTSGMILMILFSMIFQYTPQSTLPNIAYRHVTLLSPRDNILNKMCRHPFLQLRRVDIDLGREGVQMLKKRDQEELGEVIGEDELLALILKEKVQEDDCKTELGKYCKALSDAKLESEKVHKNLKDVCKEQKANEDKCTGLQDKIEEKCREFKKKMEAAPKKKPIENKNCEEYELQCLFLEGACPSELTGECNELRNECYEKKRNEVAEEIALRALKGKLKETKKEECENELKKHCPILSRMSQELMEKCLDPEGTCQSLITEAENKCTSLTEKVKDKLNNIEDETCKTLLEQCYFYGPNCEKKDRPECEKLKKECEEKYDIMYIPPEEPWFPIQPMPDITDKVGLEELYEATAKKGVLIEKLHVGMEDLIFFLSQKSQGGNFDQGEFRKINKNKCDYLKTLSGDSNYDCDKLENKYNQLERKFVKERKDLEEHIKDTGLFSESNRDGSAKTIPWHKLDSDFNGRKCAQLQSGCFFLSRYNNKLTTACDNVQAMCYSRGLNLAAYETLESQMRGIFNRLTSDWPNQCQKKLVEVCDKVKNRNHILLALCSDPEDTCFLLFNDIRDKAGQLKDILDFKRDFPEDDCLELEARCYKLKQDDTFLLGQPCHTLERNCHHLRESKQLKDLLLEEKKDHLQNVKNCTSALNAKCDNWSRKVHKKFELSCALQNDTCEIIDFYIEKYCENLIRNINESKIVNTLNEAKDKMDKLRELCPRWMPYCDALLSSCKSELYKDENNNETLSPKIQELCQPYQERQALEDEVLYEFRGNLTNTNTCNTTLEERCSTWTQENNTFSSLCKKNSTYDSDKDDTQVKKELCERLVKRVKKWCKTLLSKLEEENKELAKRIGFYNDLKQEAEEKANKTNVILTFSIKNNNTDKTNNTTNETNSTTSHALVKRSERQPPITVLEASTFDLVAMVITEYVELEEKCKKLRLDCGFKIECPDSETPCKGIEKSCDKLEPLKMKPPQTITTTITTTTAETGKAGESCSKTVTLSGNMTCGSVHTTDTWVTHTSTHTSTMTKTSTITSKVTIVSTKKCQPTQCTTDRTHPTHTSGGEEAGDVKPSGGIRCRADIDLGRERVQMLKKRDQVGKGEEMGEEELLALILKEDAMKDEDNCKKKLENYCKTLSDAELTSEKVHKKLEDVCKEKMEEKKCKGLKEKIQDKCEPFKNELETALGKKLFTEEICEKHEQKCLFLEGACSSDLTEKCSEVRNKCYLMRRVKVAGEVLLKALKGELKETGNQCKNELEKHCVHLASMSRELLWRCLNVEKTCEDLVDVAKNKCDSLKTKVENVNNVKNDSCHSLLEECHFYGPNCKEDEKIKNKCNELRTQCEDKHDIMYIPPEGPFIPIHPRVSIIEKVGLKELYQEMAKKGVLIERVLFSVEDLILFLSQKKDGEFDQGKCKEVFEKNCTYLKTLTKHSKYDCKDKCDNLKGELTRRRNILKQLINDNYLFNEENQARKGAEIKSWHKLASEYISEHCANLESECFYLEARRKTSQESKACQNVFAACYKRGVDAAAYERLESRMRGEFRSLTVDWSKKCQEKLIKVCEKVKTQNHDLLALCLYPEETCDILRSDIQMKVHQLKDILDSRRDYPEEHDCLELEPKCKILEKDSFRLSEPCHTLKRNCRHLRELGEIQKILLDEKKDHFQAIDNCTAELNQQCNHWSRKVHKPFGLSCALQEDSCERMTFNVYRYCENLIRNINESEIVNTLKGAKNEIEKLKELCPTWLPFCNQLSSTCPEEVNQDGLNISFCQEIQTYCEPYKTREALENKVMYEFQGSLTNNAQCMFKLKSYCIFWEQMDNNTYKSLVSLCKDTTSDPNKNDTQVKERLCERLLYRVKKLCKKLPDKLKKEKEELSRRIEFYEKLKEDAKQKANTTNVILTFSIKNDTTNKTNTTSHALVKRSEHHPTITETEAEAFDLVAMVITEYVELEEKCRKLLLDCGFEKECPESKDPCKGIKESCNNLKPLEMRPPEVTTSTTTTTTTTTTTVGTGGAAGESNCTSIHTTDTWVTHTSTHTSTMTKTSTITSKVTIVSTKKCQPTQCTTDRTHPTHGSGGEEAGDVKPSGGIRVNGWGT
ncbi:hypothetical protein PCANB_001677, partial [Pneumocystis canis]